LQQEWVVVGRGAAQTGASKNGSSVYNLTGYAYTALLAFLPPTKGQHWTKQKQSHHQKHPAKNGG
jgi:hypothetical protein